RSAPAAIFPEWWAFHLHWCACPRGGPPRQPPRNSRRIAPELETNHPGTGDESPRTSTPPDLGLRSGLVLVRGGSAPPGGPAGLAAAVTQHPRPRSPSRAARRRATTPQGPVVCSRHATGKMIVAARLWRQEILHVPLDWPRRRPPLVRGAARARAVP